MAYHHLALATRNMKAVDHFYREVMGFDLKKVEIGRASCRERVYVLV